MRYLSDNFKNLDSIIRLLAIIFPVLLINVKIFGNLILLIFVVIGIYRIISEKINPFTNKDLRIFTFLTLGYFFIMAMSIILNVGFDEELKHLFRKIHFLLAPLIALALYKKNNLNIFDLLKSVKVALVIASSIIFIEYIAIDDAAHPSGMFNPNILGDLLVVYLFISIVGIFKEAPKELIFTFFTFFIGTIALLLTGSRGSILTFGILFFVFLLTSFRKLFLQSTHRKLAVILFFLLGIILVFSFPFLSSTYDKTRNNIATWNKDHSSLSSSGMRLQIWNAGIEAHKQAPWYGYGYRLANKEVANYSNEHKREITNFTHLHNEYLTHLLSAGFVGLAALFLLLFVPSSIFLINREKESINMYAVAGIFLCTSYFFFGFTHIAFGEEHVNAFFIFMLAFLLPNITFLSQKY